MSARAACCRSLPKDCNFSTSTISELCNGQSWPNLQTIAQMESLLEATLWDITARKTYEENLKNQQQPSDEPSPPSSEETSPV